MLPYILDGIPPDLNPSRRTTSERNTPDTGMPDQSRAGGITGPIDEIQNSGREASILDYLSKHYPLSITPESRRETYNMQKR